MENSERATSARPAECVYVPIDYFNALLSHRPETSRSPGGQFLPPAQRPIEYHPHHHHQQQQQPPHFSGMAPSLPPTPHHPGYYGHFAGPLQPPPPPPVNPQLAGLENKLDSLLSRLIREPTETGSQPSTAPVKTTAPYYEKIITSRGVAFKRVGGDAATTRSAKRKLSPQFEAVAPVDDDDDDDDLVFPGEGRLPTKVKKPAPSPSVADVNSSLNLVNQTLAHFQTELQNLKAQHAAAAVAVLPGLPEPRSTAPPAEPAAPPPETVDASYVAALAATHHHQQPPPQQHAHANNKNEFVKQMMMK
nr:putative assembly protein [lung-eye-trachea disease-associated herpesvirus]